MIAKTTAICGFGLLALLGCSSGGSSGGGTPDGGGTGGSGGGGGVSGGGGVGPGPARTLEEYCQMDAALSKAWCDYADKCCSQADKDDISFTPPACIFGPDDPAECVQFVKERMADGTMAFDGTWADACIAKQAAGIPAPPASCSGLPGAESLLQGHGTPGFAKIPECRKVWVGLVKEGGACDYESQCAEGLKCDDDGSGTFVCQPVGTVGSKCILESDCDDALDCNSKLGQCAPLSGLGSPCLYSSECEDGLLCASGTCATPIPLGGSCVGKSGACTPGTGCSYNSNTCLAASADGQTCTTSLECAGRCDSSLGQCVSICGGDKY
ncbi:MAG: hypothetical protein IPM35_23490 [Myxococcales bacterium]|nr:hypothetical protein [Myxococcales bacterium]